MATIKFAEWENGGGNWYVGLYRTSAVPEKWYVEWKLTNLAFDEYIKMLQNYGANTIKYYAPTNCLIYSFPSKEKAHKYVLERNKQLRKLGLK